MKLLKKPRKKKQKNESDSEQPEDDDSVSLTLSEDLINVAYWVYCNKIVPQENKDKVKESDRMSNLT